MFFNIQSKLNYIIVKHKIFSRKLYKWYYFIKKIIPSLFNYEKFLDFHYSYLRLCS